jgi:hypothetical protein
MKTMAGVRLAARARLLVFPISNPPIRQARRPAATQKIANSVLRLLSLFAAKVLFDLLQI